VEFRIGKVIAKCPACGSTSFESDTEQFSGSESQYHCSKCGAEYRYKELIVQMGRESQRQTREVRAAKQKRNGS
jgi:transposase-like protein